MFGSFLSSLWSLSNHTLLASPSRHCCAIDWNPHLQQARVRRARSILGVVMQVFLMMMAVTGAKEPPIANRTAIRVLRKQNVTEPIFGAGSSGTGKLFATAIGASGRLSMRSGFIHGKSFAGDTYPTTPRRPNKSGSSVSLATIPGRSSQPTPAV